MSSRNEVVILGVEGGEVAASVAIVGGGRVGLPRVLLEDGLGPRPRQLHDGAQVAALAAVVGGREDGQAEAVLTPGVALPHHLVSATDVPQVVDVRVEFAHTGTEDDACEVYGCVKFV